MRHATSVGENDVRLCASVARKEVKLGLGPCDSIARFRITSHLRFLIALRVARAAADGKSIKVSARRGSTEYGICSTAFLEQAFRTESYDFEVTFHDDGSWSYVSELMLAVHGQEGLFNHKDQNRLFKVGEPQPNPLWVIEQSKG